MTTDDSWKCAVCGDIETTVKVIASRFFPFSDTKCATCNKLGLAFPQDVLLLMRSAVEEMEEAGFRGNHFGLSQAVNECSRWQANGVKIDQKKFEEIVSLKQRWKKLPYQEELPPMGDLNA